MTLLRLRCKLQGAVASRGKIVVVDTEVCVEDFSRLLEAVATKLLDRSCGSCGGILLTGDEQYEIEDISALKDMEEVVFAPSPISTRSTENNGKQKRKMEYNIPSPSPATKRTRRQTGAKTQWKQDSEQEESEEEESEQEESEEEEEYEEEGSEIVPDVGDIRFVVESGVEYPVEVRKVLGNACEVKFLRYRTIAKVPNSELLPFCPKKFRDFEKNLDKVKAEMKRQTSEKRKREQALKAKQKEARKRQRELDQAEKERQEETRLRELYGTPTARSGLRNVLGQPGMLVVQSHRLIYFALDNETVVDISNTFDIDHGKILYDNCLGIPKLTKTSRLKANTHIVLPHQWGGKFVKFHSFDKCIYDYS